MRIMRAMLPMAHIRTEVFRMSQAAFAEVAGTTQPTVSRWESGKWEPNRDELALIRKAALDRGLPWDDALFFEVPPAEAAA